MSQCTQGNRPKPKDQENSRKEIDRGGSQKHDEKFLEDFYPPVPPAPPPSQEINPDRCDYQSLHSDAHFSSETDLSCLNSAVKRRSKGFTIAHLLFGDPEPFSDWTTGRREETEAKEIYVVKEEEKKTAARKRKGASKTRKKREEDAEKTEKDEGDTEKQMKKKRRKYVPRQGIAEWDAQHRKGYQNYTKGMVLVRCEDAGAEPFGKQVWMVDSYQLIQKYVLEKEDDRLGIKVFARTDRFAGWLADEVWSYYHLRAVIVSDDLKQIEVSVFPSPTTVRDFCQLVKMHHPFSKELADVLKRDEQKRLEEIVPGEKQRGPEVTDELYLEVADDLVNIGREIKTEPCDETEDDGLEDLLEMDKTKLFFFGKS